MPRWLRWALAAAGLTCATGSNAGLAHLALRSPSGGGVHALVVGINKYGGVNRLSGAVADAEDIAAALRRRGVNDVALLVDEDATRAAFVADMDRIVAQAAPGDLVVLAISGISISVPEQSRWRGSTADWKAQEFVLPGYSSSGPYTKEVIDGYEFKAWLSRLDQKGIDVLFVADCMFGGGPARPSPAAPSGGDEFVPIPITPREMSTKIADIGHLTFLAGGDKDHAVPEVAIPTLPTPRGALSFAVARAIEGAAADAGVTTRHTLFDYISRQVQLYSDTQRIDAAPPAGAPLDQPVFRLVNEPDTAPGATGPGNR